MQPRENLVGQLRVKRRNLAAESGGEYVLHLAAQARRIAVARHIDKTGNIAPEGVAAHEHRYLLALLKVKDAGRHRAQFVLADLKQLVARQGFQNVDERFAVMAVRRKSGTVDKPPNLAPDHGNRLDLLVVYGRREKTDKQTLADRIAAGVELFDHHGVEMDAAMDR